MAFGADLNQAIDDLTAQFHQATEGGFQLEDVLAFVMASVVALTGLARQYQDIPDKDKLRRITAALKRVYMSRNPDVPWLSEPFETMVEQALFAILVPQLYQVLMREQGSHQPARLAIAEVQEEPA